jgi:hypothetical protein
MFRIKELGRVALGGLEPPTHGLGRHCRLTAALRRLLNINRFPVAIGISAGGAFVFLPFRLPGIHQAIDGPLLALGDRCDGFGHHGDGTVAKEAAYRRVSFAAGVQHCPEGMPEIANPEALDAGLLVCLREHLPP